MKNQTPKSPPLSEQETTSSQEKAEPIGKAKSPLNFVSLFITTLFIVMTGAAAYYLGLAILQLIDLANNQLLRVILLWSPSLVLFLGGQFSISLLKKIKAFGEQQWQKIKKRSSPKNKLSEQQKKTKPLSEKKRRVWVNVLIFAVSIPIVLFLLEGGARIYDRVNHLPKNADYFSSAESPALEAYDFVNDSDYFSERRDSIQADWNEDRTFQRHADFNGKYFVIENQLRRTVGQPQNYDHTIYIFGGSTVFGFYVPDQYTIPSYLQAVMNETYGETYRVVNMGVVSMNIFQQFELLETINLQPDDIVVFYDGINDAYGIYDYCSKWQIENGICPDPPPQPPRLIQNLIQTYHRVIAALQTKSRFVYHVLAPDNFPPHHYRDQDKMQELSDGIIWAWGEKILEINQYCSEQGVTFIHLLQPVLFKQNQFTDYEMQIIKSPSANPAGLAKGINLIFVGFEEKTALLAQEGNHVYSLTEALNPSLRPQGEEYYMDWRNINPKGNEVIADHIFDVISQLIENGSN